MLISLRFVLLNLTKITLRVFRYLTTRCRKIIEIEIIAFIAFGKYDILVQQVLCFTSQYFFIILTLFVLYCFYLNFQ